MERITGFGSWRRGVNLLLFEFRLDIRILCLGFCSAMREVQVFTSAYPCGGVINALEVEDEPSFPDVPRPAVDRDLGRNIVQNHL